MGEVIPHFCTGVGCESLHAGHGESVEVKVAKINADRDIEVARIQRSEARQAIEAETEQTKMETEAEVESAVAEAIVTSTLLGGEGAPAEAPADPEPEPMPDPVEPVMEETAAPPELDNEPPKEKKKPGYWDAYA